MSDPKDGIFGHTVSLVEHMDLLALADFNLVARHQGFGRAARATGRPKATLSRRVADLERELGLRLLERGARTLKLTEEGQALHARTGQLLAEIDEIAAGIASGGGQPRGRLRITAPTLFSQAAMGTLAAGFRLRYPEVRLEVTTEDRPVDMVEEGYDLAIRVNPDPDEKLVGRIFLRDYMVVVGSPELASTGDAPMPAVVRGAADPATVWTVSTDAGEASLAIEPVLSLSSMFLVRDAVKMGVGLGRLPFSLVSNDLNKGQLVKWGDVPGPEVALWALYPSRRLLNPRVSAFLDWLRESFPLGTAEELAAHIAART
jgi:DNA-binding transcriptional LysR family regulator